MEMELINSNFILPRLLASKSLDLLYLNPLETKPNMVKSLELDF